MSHAIKDMYRPAWTLGRQINQAQVKLMVGLCAAAIVGEYVLILKLFDWLGITGG